MEAPAISGPTILLRSGNYFDLQDPSASRFEVSDIAHALSNICRFTGHTQRFYSVAEHSVICSHMVPPEDAMAALMHDASEAFIGDVSTPLKSLLPDYKSLEHRVEQAVWSRLGLPPTLPPSVKVADRRALAVEQRVCMGNGDDWGIDEPTDEDCALIRFLSPEDARTAFLDRYHDLRCAP